MRVEAYRIGPGAEGYDEGNRYNVDVVGDDGRILNRWQFIGRESTRINAVLEAGKHPCRAYWAEAGQLRLICTEDDAQEEFVEGVLFRQLVKKPAAAGARGTYVEDLQ